MVLNPYPGCVSVVLSFPYISLHVLEDAVGTNFPLNFFQLNWFFPVTARCSLSSQQHTGLAPFHFTIIFSVRFVLNKRNFFQLNWFFPVTARCSLSSQQHTG
jgi:hypothetical protein